MSTPNVTDEELEDVKQYLVAVNDDATVGEPTGLTDTLKWKLGKRGARRLANVLIDMATDPRKPNLQAIMYIFDRIEGKPRQQVITTHEEDDPLLKLIKEMNADPTPLPNNAGLAGRKVHAARGESESESVDAPQIRESVSNGTWTEVTPDRPGVESEA